MFSKLDLDLVVEIGKLDLIAPFKYMSPEDLPLKSRTLLDTIHALATWCIIRACREVEENDEDLGQIKFTTRMQGCMEKYLDYLKETEICRKRPQTPFRMANSSCRSRRRHVWYI